MKPLETVPGGKNSGSLYSPWPSLVTQPPKTHVKKGSDIIVYNELSQTLECGATNQIAPFAINAQSAQFIMKIILTKNATRMCHVVALVSRTCQKGSVAA